MSTESPNRPRTALAVAEIAAVFMLIIGLCIGLTERTTSSFGGASCGSVFSGSDAAACNQVLSAPTVWTWLLLIVGAVILIAGQVSNIVQQISRGAGTNTAPA